MAHWEGRAEQLCGLQPCLQIPPWVRPKAIRPYLNIFHPRADHSVIPFDIVDQTKSGKSQALWILYHQPAIHQADAGSSIVPAVRFVRENPEVNSRHVPYHGKTCVVECRLEDRACGLMRGCLTVTAGPGGSTFSSPQQEAASRSPAFGAVPRGPLLAIRASLEFG